MNLLLKLCRKGTSSFTFKESFPLHSFYLRKRKYNFFHHKRNKSKRNEALAYAEFFIDPEIDLACMVGTLYEAELKSEREIAGSSL